VSAQALGIGDLLGAGAVVLELRARDKARLLEELAARAAPASGVGAEAILEALRRREALGSTGMGRGFALPHARVAGIRRLSGLFARLARPLAFEAVDDAPVDLVFLLLIPPDAGAEHVGALASIARRLRQEEVMQALRRAKDAAEAYAVLTAG
jgi:nitrogen PTS system EIIA component